MGSLAAFHSQKPGTENKMDQAQVPDVDEKLIIKLLNVINILQAVSVCMPEINHTPPVIQLSAV